VEVKSTSFKKDYFRSNFFFGVPVRKKDFDYSFDLLAVVNFLREKKKNFDDKCVILYFLYDELVKLRPHNPYRFIPYVNLERVLSDKIKNFFNNYQIGIALESKFIFDKVNFSEHNKTVEEISFPSWFGRDEGCEYVTRYHKSWRSFQEEEVKKKWDFRRDVVKATKMARKATTHNKFVETHDIDDLICRNCKKCEFPLTKKRENYN
jgi:hypothetical protein